VQAPDQGAVVEQHEEVPLGPVESQGAEARAAELAIERARSVACEQGVPSDRHGEC
jgi:hypothetical protein